MIFMGVQKFIKAKKQNLSFSNDRTKTIKNKKKKKKKDDKLADGFRPRSAKVKRGKYHVFIGKYI